MNDNELDRLLLALHEEELPPGALAAVRARVEEKLARRKSWRFAAWLWAPSAAVVTLLALFVLTPGFRPAPVLKLIVRTPPAPANDITLTLPELFREARRAAAASAEKSGMTSKNAQKIAKNVQKTPPKSEKIAVPARPEPAPAERTEFVKIFTDDPDVVILWAMNTKGE